MASKLGNRKREENIGFESVSKCSEFDKSPLGIKECLFTCGAGSSHKFRAVQLEPVWSENCENIPTLGLRAGAIR